MTDSELTRLAFKAAFNGADINHDQDMLKRWSPLTDDGDALRLAVKLDITLYQYGHEVSACNERGTVNESVEKVGDPYAATRRAIVRAAAAIGEAMP